MSTGQSDVSNPPIETPFSGDSRLSVHLTANANRVGRHSLSFLHGYQLGFGVLKVDNLPKAFHTRKEMPRGGGGSRMIKEQRGMHCSSSYLKLSPSQHLQMGEGN